MITKNELKYYSDLNLKKNRNEERKFIVEGPKLITEALVSNYECELILSSFKFFEDSPEFFNHRYVKKNNIELIKQKELEKVCDTTTPQGIAGVFRFREADEINNIVGSLIVALENVSDPGNMGTILRNCDWFGIRTVMLSENCAEVYNPKTIRASAGSLFHLNIIAVKNFYEEIKKVKDNGYKVLCTDIKGENIFKFGLPEKLVIALSSEAHGPTEKLLSISDHIVTIPKKGKAESLNVASASAVLLSELTRD